MDHIERLKPRYGEAPIPAPSPTRTPIANVRIDEHRAVTMVLSETTWPGGRRSVLVELAHTWDRDRQGTQGRSLLRIGRKNLDELIAALTSARAALDGALTQKGTP